MNCLSSFGMFTLAVLIVFLAGSLGGCGGGGGTPTPTPTPKTGCTNEQVAKHCTKCDDSRHLCTACGTGYGLDANGTQCLALCLLPGYKRPENPPPGVYNGIAWPMDCHNETTAHFFGIGDWGGLSPGVPAPNFGGGRTCQPPVDLHAQSYVAHVMNDRAKMNQPKFVLNAGDNFYWGGIGVAGDCGKAAKTPSVACSTDGLAADFQTKFENIYKGPGMDNVPWFSVLGNHDWGGNRGYANAWDLQMFRTYCPNSRWRMPGLWWHQKVQFRDFAVDVYMLDSNTVDARADHDHRICNGGGVCDVTNFTIHDANDCMKQLDWAWEEGKNWLKKKLSESTAEWQIAVTHYPPGSNIPDWQKIIDNSDLDLIFTGHKHHQELSLVNEAQDAPKGTTWIISGGGGGITSENNPDKGGNDEQYGFVDFTLSREEMKIEMISHGGAEHKEWIITNNGGKGDIIKPRPKKHVASHVWKAGVDAKTDEKAELIV